MSAENILGKTTPCGWEVFQQVNIKQHSGGNFCVRYLVRNDRGDIAFLKAMDLSRAAQNRGEDRLKHIKKLVTEYLFERDILNTCRDMNMRKVVIPLSAGKIELADQAFPLDEVYYIVFEKASDDLRQAFISSPPQTWYTFFRAIKHTCIGLEELRRAQIAHQDIKPSNILNFSHGVSKIADLGRVVDYQQTSPFSNLPFSGDYSYAPPEIHLGVELKSFSERYLADIYAVGSLVYQVLMGVKLTAALLSEAASLSQGVNKLSYSEALPVYEAAFYNLLDQLHKDTSDKFDEAIGTAVSSIIEEMCHPNYEKRGVPGISSINQRTNPRRYTSKLNEILRLMKIKGFA